jgi:hypothetical protein
LTTLHVVLRKIKRANFKTPTFVQSLRHVVHPATAGLKF